MSKPYWMEVPPLIGNTHELPKTGSVVIIGSGLSGVSVGYFLTKHGFEDVSLIDYRPEECASFRNGGHILFGTVESMKALCEIHGKEKAREVWQFSIQVCNQIEKTVLELGLDADYRRDGYLVIAISEVEDQECRDSVQLLNSLDFQSDYLDSDSVRELGFQRCFGARYERGSASAHPIKFRNGVLQAFQNQGGQYYSDACVKSIDDIGGQVLIRTHRGDILAEAVVIAANAYSPLFSDFFKHHELIEPFRGQVLTSKPLRHHFKVKYPHSFDHGYQYALVTSDNRLLLGGWRQHTKDKDIGTYSLETGSFITEGLTSFAYDYYGIKEKIDWEYNWCGIMGASKTSLPFIGPTTSPRIFACAGYTGHGFSWAHGSAMLLADIMAGKPIPAVAKYFNPKATI